MQHSPASQQHIDNSETQVKKPIRRIPQKLIAIKRSTSLPTQPSKDSHTIPPQPQNQNAPIQNPPLTQHIANNQANIDSLAHDTSTQESPKPITQELNYDANPKDTLLQHKTTSPQHTQAPLNTLKDSHVSNSQDLSLQDTLKPQNLYIQVDTKTFNLNLENLDEHFRNKLITIFQHKEYSVMELVAMLLENLRNQTRAEQELLQMIHALKAQLTSNHINTPQDSKTSLLESKSTQD